MTASGQADQSRRRGPHFAVRSVRGKGDAMHPPTRKPRTGRAARATATRGFVVAEYTRDVGKLTNHRGKAHALLAELHAAPRGERHEWVKGRYVVIESYNVPLGTRGLSALRGLLTSRGFAVYYGRGPDEAQGRINHQGTGGGPEAPRGRELRAKLRELERSHTWDEQDMARFAYGADAPVMLRRCAEWERTQELSAEWYLSGRDFVAVHLAFCDSLADAGNDKAQDWVMGIVCWGEERDARRAELGRYSALTDAEKHRDSRTIVGQAPVTPKAEHKPRKALRNVVPGKPARPADALVFASHGTSQKEAQARLTDKPARNQLDTGALSYSPIELAFDGPIAVSHAAELARFVDWLRARVMLNTSR